LTEQVSGFGLIIGSGLPFILGDAVFGTALVAVSVFDAFAARHTGLLLALLTATACLTRLPTTLLTTTLLTAALLTASFTATLLPTALLTSSGGRKPPVVVP
jgi:hypothetical protein